MTTKAIYQGYHTEAVAALHQVETGQSVELTTFDGVTTKFTPANADRLRGYIARLEGLIAGRRTRGALTIRFKG